MRYLKRLRSDEGAANSISFMVIIFFVMLIMVSFIDMGMYFNVKNEMQSAAENGARNVALYGGTATSLRATKKATKAETVVSNSINDKFRKGGRSKTVTVKNISCGPGRGVAAGDKVWCRVEYQYKGLIGNKGLFFKSDQNVIVEGSSVSEVFSQN